VYQSNGTCAQVVYQLGQGFADFDGCTVEHVVSNAASGQGASFDLEQAGILGWRGIYNTNSHFQIQDSLNGAFSRLDFSPGGNSALASYGTGGESVDASTNSGTGNFCKYSGGATPTIESCLNATGGLTLYGSTSGSALIQTPAVAGNPTITTPKYTSTLAGVVAAPGVAMYSTSSGTINLYTNPDSVAHEYILTFYGWVSTVGTAGTVTCTDTFSNGTFSPTHTLFSSLSLSSATSDNQSTATVEIAAGSTLSYSCPFTGATGSPVLSIDATVEQVR
jgi:hypothetical protein